MLENSLKEKLQLYAVTGRNCLREKTLYEAVEEALKGGVTLLQLREKTSSVGDIIKEMKDLHPLCVRYGVPLIVNDSIEIASACNADGVHLGQGDGSIREARQKLGGEKIIGATAKTVEQAKRAEAEGADYLGCGDLFGSPTKKNAVRISLDALREICQAVSIPVVAIGGIRASNIHQLYHTGIAGVAVVSGIFGQENIRYAASELASLVKRMV